MILRSRPIFLDYRYHQYVLKRTRGKCETVADHGAFRIFHKFIASGKMKLLDQIKIQCFKSVSLLYMLDLVFEMMIMGY